MKEIKAYVTKEELDDVVHALEVAGAPEVTIVRVELAGADVRPEWVDVMPVPPVRHNPRLMKLELVCQNEEAERYAAVIRGLIGASAHSHIAVSDIDLCD